LIFLPHPIAWTTGDDKTAGVIIKKCQMADTCLARGIGCYALMLPMTAYPVKVKPVKDRRSTGRNNNRQ